MKECIDEGTLQAWLDGELGPEAAAAVATHLVSCPNCAESARTAENENLLLANAMQSEFADSVPTERIRQRLDSAIAGNEIVEPARSDRSDKISWWQSLRDQVFPSPQRAFGYAAVAAVIVLSAIFGVVYLKRDQGVPVAQKEHGNPIAPTTTEPAPAPVNSTAGPAVKPSPAVNPNAPIERPNKVIAHRTPRTNRTGTGLLPGEQNYVNRIAVLDKSLKSNSPMRPSLQVEYEHNVALLDSAIEMTRDAVRKNPNDTQASRFMFAAYQSKVDLLNQVADARRFNSQK
jgi:anti-sigma factor RsiW